MAPDQIEAVRRRVVADRRAQGLPDHVTDPGVLRRIALLIAGRDEGGVTPPPSTSSPSSNCAGYQPASPH